MEPTLKSKLYQFGFGISAGLAVTCAGTWLSWPSAVIPSLKDGSLSITLSGSQISTMVALMDLGNILSPVPTSYLMDLIGRKKTLMICGILCLLASLCVLVMTNIGLIYTARMLAGLSKGIAFSSISIYLAEIASTQIRGALSTMFSGFLNIGSMYDLVIGPYFGYFYLNVANLVIPVAFLLAIINFPESPYYLVMKNREFEAKKSLSRYRQKSESDSKQNGLDDEMLQITEKVKEDMKNKGRFIDLVTTSSNRRALLIISFLAFFQRSSGISPIIVYSSSTMPAEGGGLPPSAYMVMFSVLHVVATYAATPFVDTWGRKPLLLISSLGSGITTGVMSVYYFMETYHYDVSSIKWIPYAGLLIYSTTYSLGLGFLPSAYVGELFPTNVKSYAGSVSAMTLAAVSFVLNKIFQSVADEFGIHVMYWYFSISSFVAVVFVYFYVIETKGKTLKDIQIILAELD